MRKTLGAVIFTRDCIKFDYCFIESLECLLELCDQVSVVDVGSTDGTLEALYEMQEKNYRLFVTSVPDSDWHKNKDKGKERISIYQNLALAFLDTDYYILLQADEVIPEYYFSHIRSIIEYPVEGVCIGRINLWGDCNSYISVSDDRQPCSTKVVRIAKTKYRSYDDGESIAVPNPYTDITINIIHYGFVRKKEVMKAKVENMQAEVFGIDPDPKLYQSDVFDSTLWFSGDDLSKLHIPHPKYMTQWIQARP